MDRVLIIGCPGSGKTTLALKLSEITGLPLVHLDRLFWEDNWTQVSQQVFDDRLSLELQKPRWIIDGNYGRTLPLRLQCCDTVLYLDYSRRQCLWGAITRILKNYGKSRPDMGSNCPERFDWEFLKSIWQFSRRHRKKYHEILGKTNNIAVFCFCSRREAAGWLAGIQKRSVPEQ